MRVRPQRAEFFAKNVALSVSCELSCRVKAAKEIPSGHNFTAQAIIDGLDDLKRAFNRFR